MLFAYGREHVNPYYNLNLGILKFENSRPKYQRTRLPSSTQWCSKEKDSKMNQFWTSKHTINLLKPFNIPISTHAIHPALKMVSLKAKQ